MPSHVDMSTVSFESYFGACELTFNQHCRLLASVNMTYLKSLPGRKRSTCHPWWLTPKRYTSKSGDKIKPTIQPGLKSLFAVNINAGYHPVWNYVDFIHWWKYIAWDHAFSQVIVWLIWRACSVELVGSLQLWEHWKQQIQSRTDQLFHFHNSNSWTACQPDKGRM